MSLFFFWSLSFARLIPCHAQTMEGRAGAFVGVDNLDGPVLELGAQTGAPGATRFGLRLRAGLARERFIGGYAVGGLVEEPANVVEAMGHATWNLRQRAGLRFDLTTGVGVRGVFADAPTPAGARSLAVTTRLSPTLTKQLSSTWSLFTSIHIDTDIAVDPATELDLNALPMQVGLRHRLSPTLALTASAMVGPAFGYGGDGAKYRAGATLGIEYAVDSAPAEEDAPGGVGYFLDAGWRGYALADHLSHGPEVRLGVSVWSNRLKLGLAMQGRSGPMNPKTFELQLPDGESYKGKQTLDLRSDGSNVGILIAPTFDVLQWLAVELPVTLGQAGYGFYLTGEDRQTPNGERVSEVENALQDGRDASFGLSVDAGIRAKFRLPKAPWIQPMVGIHYQYVSGYDAFITDNYNGLSVAAGVQFAAF